MSVDANAMTTVAPEVEPVTLTNMQRRVFARVVLGESPRGNRRPVGQCREDGQSSRDGDPQKARLRQPRTTHLQIFSRHAAMKLLRVIQSMSPRVEVQLIAHLTKDLRAPARSTEWQKAIDAHKRRRARECRKVRPAKHPQPPIAEPSLSRGGRQWRAPVGIPASPPVRRAPEPTALERWLTAPGLLLRQGD